MHKLGFLEWYLQEVVKITVIWHLLCAYGYGTGHMKSYSKVGLISVNSPLDFDISRKWLKLRLPPTGNDSCFMHSHGTGFY